MTLWAFRNAEYYVPDTRIEEDNTHVEQPNDNGQVRRSSVHNVTNLPVCGTEEGATEGKEKH